MAETKSSEKTSAAGTAPAQTPGPSLGQRLGGFFRAPATGARTGLRRQTSSTMRFIVGSVTFILVAELLTYLIDYANLQFKLNLQQPIIGAINGDAIGLGATLALLCDIIVVSEKARFADTHVKIGIVAGDGGAVIWPLLIGPHRAKEFLMRGHVITGAEAGRIGMVNYAVAP